MPQPQAQLYLPGNVQDPHSADTAWKNCWWDWATQNYQHFVREDNSPGWPQGSFHIWEKDKISSICKSQFCCSPNTISHSRQLCPPSLCAPWLLHVLQTKITTAWTGQAPEGCHHRAGSGWMTLTLRIAPRKLLLVYNEWDNIFPL